MMKPNPIRSSALAAIAAVGLAYTVAAQETPGVGAGPQGANPQETGTPKPTEQKPKPAPKPQEDEAKKEDKGLRELDPLGGSGPGGGAGQDEMKDLFIKVDKRLERVTELLFEASTGDGSRSSEVGAAGIDELIREAESASSAGASGIGQILEASRSQSEAAQTEIDRILEIAAQNSSGSGSQGGPPPPQSGMPQQGKTPSGSKREEKGDAPDPGGQPKDEQQQDGKEGEEPKDGQEQEGGKDGPGKQPPKSETGDASDAKGSEEWGDLPVHLRKTFQNGVSDDVPPRYRDWVDSYYKRLNRRSGR